MTKESSQLGLQELHLENRNKLTVSGVSEVESFDENAIVLETSQGMLVIRGEALHLKSLSPKDAAVVITGTVHSLVYEELRKKGGFLHRLLG